MTETPEQLHKEAEKSNVAYTKAITSETARLMKDAGFSVVYIDTIKLTVYFLGVVGALILIIYYTLLSADSTNAAGDVLQGQRIESVSKNLDTLQNAFNSSVQNMASNIYNLCLSTPGAKCVNPEKPLK